MKRQKDNGHLDFLRALPCVLCLDDTTTEAAHIRFSDIKYGKRPTGMQEKSDDAFALPMCGGHHREQHEMGERAFWNGRPMDPIKLALALYRVSGDHEAGERIVRSWH